MRKLDGWKEGKVDLHRTKNTHKLIRRNEEMKER
jgi:hypothetical protein